MNDRGSEVERELRGGYQPGDIVSTRAPGSCPACGAKVGNYQRRCFNCGHDFYPQGDKGIHPDKGGRA
jgi:hypothetical protein